MAQSSLYGFPIGRAEAFCFITSAVFAPVALTLPVVLKRIF
jgi:hypothetical protein